MIQAIGLCVVIAMFAASCVEDNVQLIKLGTGKGILTEVYLPNGASPKHVLMVLSGSSGVNSRLRSVASVAAKFGVLGVVPYYVNDYHEGGRSGTGALAIRGNPDIRKAVEAHLFAIMDQIAERYSVPRSAFYAYSFSLGGGFVRDLAARSQIRAGVILTGGYLYPDDDARRLRQLVSGNSSPLLILAGESDTVVPIAETKTIEAIFKEAGAPVEAHYFPGGEHSLHGYSGDVNRYIRNFFLRNGLRLFGSGQS